MKSNDTLLDAWNTNNKVTIFLVSHLTGELWEARFPGSPRRSVRMLAAHLHNARCMWIRTLGTPHGLKAPRNVDPRKVTPDQLVSALQRSGNSMLELLQFGCDQGDSIPATPRYVWRNLPLDVGHVLTYFVAHEAHHRGQIVMLARELGHRLPAEVTNGLWQWSRLKRQDPL